MQGVVRWTLVLAVAACGGHGVSTAPDGSSGGDDGGPGASGLTIPWSVVPAVPGPTTTDVNITTMLFRLDSLRVVGDAGTSVSIDALELQWGPSGSPPPAVFENAPSGLYSKVVFSADGDIIDYSWEIDGNVQLEDGLHPFVIHDREPLTVNIDTSAMLDPGGSATLGVQFQIDQPFADLDFPSLDNDDGTLELDTLDSQMEDFRDKLSKAIGPDHGSSLD